MRGESLSNPASVLSGGDAPKFIKTDDFRCDGRMKICVFDVSGERPVLEHAWQNGGGALKPARKIYMRYPSFPPGVFIISSIDDAYSAWSGNFNLPAAHAESIINNEADARVAWRCERLSGELGYKIYPNGASGFPYLLFASDILTVRPGMDKSVSLGNIWTCGDDGEIVVNGFRNVQYINLPRFISVSSLMFGTPKNGSIESCIYAGKSGVFIDIDKRLAVWPSIYKSDADPIDYIFDLITPYFKKYKPPDLREILIRQNVKKCNARLSSVKNEIDSEMASISRCVQAVAERQTQLDEIDESIRAAKDDASARLDAISAVGMLSDVGEIISVVGSTIVFRMFEFELEFSKVGPITIVLTREPDRYRMSAMSARTVGGFCHPHVSKNGDIRFVNGSDIPEHMLLGSSSLDLLLYVSEYLRTAYVQGEAFYRMEMTT